MNLRLKSSPLTLGDLLYAADFVIGVGVLWFVADRVGGGWPVLLLCLVAALLIQYPITLAHELGHVLAAMAMGVKVKAFNIFAGSSTKQRTLAGVTVRIGLTGMLNSVQSDTTPLRRLPAVRRVTTSLGGPAVTVALAVLAWWASWSTGLPQLARAILLTAAGFSALSAVVNLVPIRHRNGMRSDGWSALAWIAHPRRMARQQHEIALLASESHAWQTGQPVNHEVIAMLVSSLDVSVAASAALIWADLAERDELVDDAARLRSLAFARGVSTVICSRIVELLVRAMVDRIFEQPMESPERSTLVADAAELAEAGRRLQPRRVQHRTALALLRVWQGQVLGARKLLPRPDLISQPALRATAQAVQALVACELGELASARQLAAAAEATDPAAEWVAPIVAIVAARSTTEPVG
jgi:hypothetical protein